jgi:hypothetical protein
VKEENRKIVKPLLLIDDLAAEKRASRYSSILTLAVLDTGYKINSSKVWEKTVSHPG